MGTIERRLRWRSVGMHYAADFVARQGERGWERLDADAWAALPWQETLTEVIFTGDARMDQYNTLRDWELTHFQPIKDVTLEEREVPHPDTGWRPARTEAQVD